MRIAIVFNPGSGARAATGALGEVIAALASHEHQIEVFDRAAQPDFERAVREAAPELDRVIVIGGDGTLNGVVNGIMASKHPGLPMAFVPTGRGKDTARTIASWTPAMLAQGRFESAATTTVDLTLVSLGEHNRYAINIANIGLAAHAAVMANSLPRRLGAFGYVGGAARALMPPRPFRLEMSIDGEDIVVQNALLLSVCNGRSFGGGIYIAPLADPQDGMLDIVVVENANLGDLALQLRKLKAGTLHDHPALTRWRGTEVRVQPLTSPWYEIDGEQLSTAPQRFTIVPDALTWITPT